MRLIDGDVLLEKFNKTGIDVWMALTDKDASLAFALYCKVADAVEEMPTVGGWIRVEDRLPEKSGEVFVYTKNHHTASVSYSKKYNAFNWFDVLGEVRERDGGALWDVEYWMPIPPFPELPEEVNDERTQG